jgi:hypothetical protein
VCARVGFLAFGHVSSLLHFVLLSWS